MNRAKRVRVELGRDEAIVLFEFLARVANTGQLRFEDESERMVLWTVGARLEPLLSEPFSADYQHLLEKARARVRATP